MGEATGELDFRIFRSLLLFFSDFFITLICEVENG